MEAEALRQSLGYLVRDPAGRRLGTVAELRQDAVVVSTGNFFRKKLVVAFADVARVEGSALVLGRPADDYIGPVFSLKTVKPAAPGR